MNTKQAEVYVFGYAEATPPPDGSWKAGALNLIQQAVDEDAGGERLLFLLDIMKGAADRMRVAQMEFFAAMFVEMNE